MNDRSADRLKYKKLRLRAEVYEDCMKSRIRLNNRVKASDDGGVFKPLIDQLLEIETAASRHLVRQYQLTVPKSVRDWVNNTHGLGEHSIARLLGVIGDPLMAYPMKVEKQDQETQTPSRAVPNGKPYYRTVSTLRAYCGHGASVPRRRGMEKELAREAGNARAKMLVHIIADNATIKQRNPEYRAIYETAKAAKVAEGWKLIHAHNHGLRLVGKQIIKELWLAAGGAELVPVEPPPAPVKKTVRKRVAKTAA